MKRRNFLAATAIGVGTLASGVGSGTANANPATFPIEGNPSFVQPPLPYEIDALVPFLGKEQMTYHYGKHHAAYFNNLNKLIDGKYTGKITLERLIVESEGSIFNNAAQAWNHTFFWNCMTPKPTEKPTGALASAIDHDFGSFGAFAEKFTAAATTLFGSGWAWLAKDDATGKLEIMALSNADTPLKHAKTALLTIDVWEHAYYIDYRNERTKFIAGFMKQINWSFAQSLFEGSY